MKDRRSLLLRGLITVAMVLILGAPTGAMAQGSSAVGDRSDLDTSGATSTSGAVYINGHDVADMSTLGIAGADGLGIAETGPVYVLDMIVSETPGWLNIQGLLWNSGTTPIDNIGVRVSMYGEYDNFLHTYTPSRPPNVGDWVLYPDEVTSFNVIVPIHGDEYYFIVSGFGSSCAKMPIYLNYDVYTTPDRYTVTLYNDTDYRLNTVVLNHVDIAADTGEIIRVQQLGIPAMSAGGSFVQDVGCDCTGPGYLSYFWAEGLKDATPPTTQFRIAGIDRYATALAASWTSFSDTTSGTAVLVSGRDFPDALSASVLAGVCDAPILLVRDDEVGVLQDELTRRGVDTAYIVGGTGAVSGEFEDALRAFLPEGSTVERFAGIDRYATCAEVVRFAETLNGAPFPQAFVARGDSYPDALAASPFSYSQLMPVLLVRPTSVPDVILDVADEVGVVDLWALGGTGAVSDECIAQFGRPYERLAGATRYETAAVIAVTGFDEGWTDFGTLGLAIGSNFPDALAGGAAVGNQGGAVLLTTPTLLSREAGWGMMVCAQSIDTVWDFGGTGAISQLTVDTAGYLCN